MSNLKQMILEHGKVYPGNVLKVDSFLNHQIDPHVIKSIENDFYQYFKDIGVTKVLTIESSGNCTSFNGCLSFGCSNVIRQESFTKYN